MWNFRASIIPNFVLGSVFLREKHIQWVIWAGWPKMDPSEEYTKHHPDDIDPDLSMDGSQLDTLSELSSPSAASTVPIVSCKGDERLRRIAEQLAEAVQKARSGKPEHTHDRPAKDLQKGENKGVNMKENKGVNMKENKGVNMERVLPQHATSHQNFKCRYLF